MPLYSCSQPSNNFAATTAPGTSNDSTQGYVAGSRWLRTDTGQLWVCRSNAASAAVWQQIEQSDHPGYIVGNWYIPMPSGALTTGVAPGSGSIRLGPGYLKERVTINSLGVRVATLFATGNVQAAVYANNPATGRPTGNALASTASMSTTSLGSVNSSVSVQLEAGLYWFASNCDNATAAFAAYNVANTFMGAMIGSATQGNDLSATQSMVGLSVTQTFGSWPDLTSGSFVEAPAQGTVPVVQFKIGSVP